MFTSAKLADTELSLLETRVEEINEIKQAGRIFDRMDFCSRIFGSFTKEIKFKNTSRVSIKYKVSELQEMKVSFGKKMKDLLGRLRFTVNCDAVSEESIKYRKFGTVDKVVVLETLRALKEKEVRNRELMDIIDDIQSDLARNLDETMK